VYIIHVYSYELELFRLVKVGRSRASTDTVLTPSKLRPRSSQRTPTTAQSADDSMPLLKKESDETSTPSLVSWTKLRPSSDQAPGDDMPVLEKEEEEDLAADSSADSGWTSSVDKPPSSTSSLSYRCLRHLDVGDRRFGYDTREWRVPKLTIRRRLASGPSASNSGPVSLTSASSSVGPLIYEILPPCGRGSVESQSPSDESSYSDQKSTTTTASSPDSISPLFFYRGGTPGSALKRLRLKFGEESVAIDVGHN